MFGNHILRLCSRVAIKLNFRPYIRRYTSPNENFEYSYPLSVRLDSVYNQELNIKPRNQLKLNIHQFNYSLSRLRAHLKTLTLHVWQSFGKAMGELLRNELNDEMCDLTNSQVIEEKHHQNKV